MDNIKDLLSRVTLFCRLEVAIVKELENLSARCAALEENRKMKDATILKLEKKVSDLELMLRSNV